MTARFAPVLGRAACLFWGLAACAPPADTVRTAADAPATTLRAASAQPADTVRAVAIPHQTFADARGIGVDPLGALYVADAGRDVVVKMDANGFHLATIGGPGAREGEFDDPSAVDPTNGLSLYVADAGNRRLQIFSRAFAYLGALPLARQGEEASARATYRRRDGEGSTAPSGIPRSVAVAETNDVFAVDTDRRTVLKWDENRRLVGVIGGVDAGRGGLADPVDAWAGSDGLYVADRGLRSIVVYDVYGTFVRALGSGMLTEVRAVTRVGGRTVAALPRELVVFDAMGRLERRIRLDIAEELVDVVAAPGGLLYGLGSRRAYVLPVALPAADTQPGGQQLRAE